MKRRVFLIGAIFLAMTVPGRLDGESRHRHGGHNVNVTTDGEDAITSCSQIRVRFDERDAARAEDVVTARLSAAVLTIRVPESSGAYVRGGDGSDTSVKVCKAALRSEDLSGIAASLGRDGRLSVSGPSNGEWLVFLLVQTPRGSAVDLEASNGPLSVRELSGSVAARTTNGPLSLLDLSGSVRAHAENGPISIANCRGSVEAEATNGPISLRGGGGDQNLQTRNGPISVNLTGDHWEGRRLEAHADNGPLSVRIPENYRTGTRIESAGHSPFTCRAPACSGGRKSWDDDFRRVEFGSGETLVRLSTVNGPVSVKSRGDAEDDE